MMPRSDDFGKIWRANRSIMWAAKGPINYPNPAQCLNASRIPIKRGNSNYPVVSDGANLPLRRSTQTRLGNVWLLEIWSDASPICSSIRWRLDGWAAIDQLGYSVSVGSKIESIQVSMPRRCFPVLSPSGSAGLPMELELGTGCPCAICPRAIHKSLKK